MPIELTLTLGAVGAILLTLAALERNAEARRKVRVRTRDGRRER